jgi:hypothetical protein
MKDNAIHKLKILDEKSFHFVIHTLCTCFVFLLFVVIVVALDYLIDFLSSRLGVKGMILHAIAIVKYTLLLGDVVWFVARVASDLFDCLEPILLRFKAIGQNVPAVASSSMRSDIVRK